MQKPRPAKKTSAKARPQRARGRPTTQEVTQIDDSLLSAALHTFSKLGFGGASMRNIAEAANVSRTTLLARFSTKDDIFRAIMTQHIDRMGTETYLKSDGPPDLKRGLMAFANRALTYSLESDYLEVNRLIYSTPHQFPEIGAFAAKTASIGVDQIAEFIRQCAKIDGIPCRNPEFAAQTFVLLLRGWYSLIMLGNQTITAARREAWVEATVSGLIAGRTGW